MGSGGKRREKVERRARVDEGDLDSGYRSPIASWRDLTPGSLAELLKHSRYAQLLLLLTLAGACLRLYNLSYNSLWLDEAATLDFARHSYAEIWGLVAGGEFNPPLFYWIEHAMLVFGESEFVLRIVPALAGILTIPVFYLLGREIMDRNAGIVAAALLAFSPFHLFYSQEARAYSLMLLFFALAFFFFLKGLGESGFGNWIIFSIFASLSFWAFFYVIIPLAVLFIAGIIWSFLRHEGFRACLRSAGMSVVLFVMISLPLLIVAFDLFIKRTSSTPTFGVQGFTLVWRTIEFISGYNSLLSMIFLLPFIAGVAYLVLSNDQMTRMRGITIALLMVIPLLASVFLSSRMPMHPRHLAYLVVAFLPGIAVCTGPIMSVLNRRAIVYLAVVLAFLSGAWFFPGYYSSYSKEDWRGFAGILTARTEAGDAVVAVPSYMRLPLDYYYSNASDSTFEYGATTVNELEEIRERHPDRRIFLVVTSDIFAAEPEGNTVRWLERNTKLITRYTSIYLFTSSES